MAEAFLLIISWTWMIIAHLRYERANYPKSWRWRANLFLAGALATVAIGVAMGEATNLLVTLWVAFIGGVVSAWGLPMRMQYVIPKRPGR